MQRRTMNDVSFCSYKPAKTSRSWCIASRMGIIVAERAALSTIESDKSSEIV